MPAFDASSVPTRPTLQPLACGLAVLAVMAVTAVAADDARDWSGVQLAWRDDPRPPADAPEGVDVPPARRGSRRSQRRAATRRRPSFDELPAETSPTDRQWIRLSPATPFEGLDRIERFPPPHDGVVVEPMPSDALPQDGATHPFRTTSASGGPITTHRDQTYAPLSEAHAAHGRQRFDIHLPAGCSAGAMPLVIWIHGDTWRDGTKADCPIVWLAGEGYAVASIGYRPTDAAVFPAQLDDCRAAIAEIERNAEIWGIDPTRVAVAGSGAGGHLAALVGLAGHSAAPGTDPPVPTPRIAAVFAAAAPTSLTTLGPEHDRATSPASRLVGGPLPEYREAAQRASPVTHVSSDDPPVLLLHGAADTTVPPAQAVQLDAALRAAGVDSAVVMLAGVGHKPSLAQGTAGGVALLSFLDRVLGPGIRPAEPTQP